MGNPNARALFERTEWELPDHKWVVAYFYNGQTIRVFPIDFSINSVPATTAGVPTANQPIPPLSGAQYVKEEEDLKNDFARRMAETLYRDRSGETAQNPAPNAANAKDEDEGTLKNNFARRMAEKCRRARLDQAAQQLLKEVDATKVLAPVTATATTNVTDTVNTVISQYLA